MNALEYIAIMVSCLIALIMVIYFENKWG